MFGKLVLETSRLRRCYQHQTEPDPLIRLDRRRAAMQSTNFRATDRWNSVPVPARVAERAHSRWHLVGDCWVSDYSVASHGYAQIGWSDHGTLHMVLAHRASWVFEHGQVPLGMTLDHMCKNRRCVNPEHLRLLPNYENARRINGLDWPIGTCCHGHSAEYLVPVKRKTKSGSPRIGYTCRLCARAYNRKWAAANKDKIKEMGRKYREKRRGV